MVKAVLAFGRPYLNRAGLRMSGGKKWQSRLTPGLVRKESVGQSFSRPQILSEDGKIAWAFCVYALCHFRKVCFILRGFLQ